MGRGRPIAPLVLDGAERETLEQWTRRPKTAQALALRARIVLACADGRSNTAVDLTPLIVSEASRVQLPLQHTPSATCRSTSCGV